MRILVGGDGAVEAGPVSRWQRIEQVGELTGATLRERLGLETAPR